MNAKLILTATASLMLAACPSTRPYQDNPMNQDTQQRTQFTQPELLDKVLDFIRQADSFDVFTMENAQKVFGTAFVKDEDSHFNSFYADGKIAGTDENWRIMFLDTLEQRKKMHLAFHVKKKAGFRIFNPSAKWIWNSSIKN